MKKLSDEIDDLNKKIKDVEKESNNKAEHNEQELIKLRTDVTVLKGEVGALDDDLKKLSNQWMMWLFELFSYTLLSPSYHLINNLGAIYFTISIYATQLTFWKK